VVSFERLRDGPEETLEQMRAKERLFAALQAASSPVARWKAVADLWCAGWFDPGLQNLGRGTFDALLDDEAGRTLPGPVESALLARAAAVATEGRFFHWELE